MTESGKLESVRSVKSDTQGIVWCLGTLCCTIIIVLHIVTNVCTVCTAPTLISFLLS